MTWNTFHHLQYRRSPDPPRHQIHQHHLGPFRLPIDCLNLLPGIEQLQSEKKEDQDTFQNVFTPDCHFSPSRISQDSVPCNKPRTKWTHSSQSEDSCTQVNLNKESEISLLDQAQNPFQNTPQSSSLIQNLLNLKLLTQVVNLKTKLNLGSLTGPNHNLTFLQFMPRFGRPYDILIFK